MTSLNLRMELIYKKKVKVCKELIEFVDYDQRLIITKKNQHWKEINDAYKEPRYKVENVKIYFQYS